MRQITKYPFVGEGAQWWRQWWALDFSWANLKNKRLGDAPPDDPQDTTAPPYVGAPKGVSSLQDYWRIDPETGELRDDECLRRLGELVQCEGTEFHIAHLPAVTPKSAFTWKMDATAPEWDKLEALLLNRLALAHPANLDFMKRVQGYDTRAQFQGICIRNELPFPAEQRPYAIYARQMVTLGIANYANAMFGASSNFGRCAFFSSALFNRTEFFGDAEFRDCSFLANCTFANSLVSGDAVFERVRFLDAAHFIEMKVGRSCEFKHATFSKAANFAGVQITFLSNFSCRFNDLPNFSGSRPGPGFSLADASFTGLHIRAVYGQIAFASIALSCAGLAYLADMRAGPTALLVVATVLISTILGIYIPTRTEAHSARVLMSLMAEQRNHVEEARFFKYQLKAQRLEAPGKFGDLFRDPFKWTVTKPLEKLLGLAYEITSDYGTSIIRPLVCFPALVLVFALFVWNWELAREGRQYESVAKVANYQLAQDPALIDAMSFAVSRALPVGALMQNEASMQKSCSMSQKFFATDRCAPIRLLTGPPVELARQRLWAILLSGFYSAFAIFLLFSAGLAARRRFQLG